MAHVYILECSDRSYYVGSTRFLERRLWEHQQGLGGDYTAARRPVRLLWAAEFDRVVEAWAAERKLHGWSRAKKEAVMRGDFDLLPALSRGRSRSAPSASGPIDPSTGSGNGSDGSGDGPPDPSTGSGNGGDGSGNGGDGPGDGPPDPSTSSGNGRDGSGNGDDGPGNGGDGSGDGPPDPSTSSGNGGDGSGNG